MLTTVVPRGAQTPPVRRDQRDSYRQSRPKSMPNLDDAQVKVQQQSEPLRSSSSIGNVIASTGESTQDQFSYEARDLRHAEPAREHMREPVREPVREPMRQPADEMPEEETVDHVITLKRDERGFGFRIVGGQEEGTQVIIFF